MFDPISTALGAGAGGGAIALLLYLIKDLKEQLNMEKKARKEADDRLHGRIDDTQKCMQDVKDGVAEVNGKLDRLTDAMAADLGGADKEAVLRILKMDG